MAARTRNYACVVYPESAPANWQEILMEEKTPAFISPLHDMDVDPLNQPKKPHFHVMFMYEGVKTEHQVKEVFSKFGGVGLEVVKSIRGYARYLCHLDNPEKHQYNQILVQSLFGADYSDTISLAVDRRVALKEMEDWCERYDIRSFYQLARFASAERPDWSKVLMESGAFYMREYLQSRHWSRKEGYGDIVDPDTGEVVFKCTRFNDMER